MATLRLYGGTYCTIHTTSLTFGLSKGLYFTMVCFRNDALTFRTWWPLLGHLHRNSPPVPCRESVCSCAQYSDYYHFHVECGEDGMAKKRSESGCIGMDRRKSDETTTRKSNRVGSVRYTILPASYNPFPRPSYIVRSPPQVDSRSSVAKSKPFLYNHYASSQDAALGLQV